MQTRLRGALRTGTGVLREDHLRFAPCWDTLTRTLQREPVRVAIFDPGAGATLDLGPAAALRAGFPSVALLPYGAFSASDLPALARFALDAEAPDVVVAGVNDEAPALRRAVEAALSRPLVDRVIRECGALFPPALAPLLRTLLEAPERPTPAEAAARFGAHDKTLRLHLRSAGLPSVNKLIVWTRLFHAAHLLEDPARSAESVAWLLGYDAPSALHNHFRGYVGATASQVRRGGGLAMVLRRFHERHQQRRWEVSREEQAQNRSVRDS